MTRTFTNFRDIELIITDNVEYDFGTPILSEAVHQEIQGIMDDADVHASQKFPRIVKKVRELISQGVDTGLESDKPKKGSSRAVYFPTEHKRIILDGQEVHVPTAIKIAFPGQLDKYTGDKHLLGEHQNRAENAWYIQKNYSILRHIRGNEYETNPSGVLMPLFDGHPDGHHLECGRCEKYNAADVRRYTKNDMFKKGLSHRDIQDAMSNEHRLAHGGYNIPILEHITDHEHVRNMIHMMHDSGMHPGDLDPRNMGVFVHPITGVRHPVVIDYGFTKEISKLYDKARRG